MIESSPTSTVTGRGSVDTRRKLLVILEDRLTEHVLPEGGAVVVGRDRSADLVIDHQTLSRRHAKLTLSYHVTIEDEGSSNGTIVGGRRLAKGEVVLVAPGASIELGDALLVLRTTGGADVIGTSEGDASANDRSLERKLARIAKTQAAVVVAGESGVGKSFVAKRIHALSAQAAAPFIELRCQSALEVREAGAAVAAAHTGTLFLREPSALSRQVQVALANEIRAAGRSAPRMVTATTKDLSQLAEGDAFAADLLRHIATLTLVIPPLRARHRELPAIVQELAHAVAVENGRPAPLVSTDALAMLGRHTWPGNVHELRMVLTRAMLAGGRVLTASHFSFDLQPAAGAEAGTLSSAVSDAEHRRILEVLRECSGNQSRAAKMLGISRGTLISRLERYAIPRPRK